MKTSEKLEIGWDGIMEMMKKFHNLNDKQFAHNTMLRITNLLNIVRKWED